jgi:glutathione S-transferase
LQKLETYLRMTGMPFEIVPNASLAKAPKGKMPYIEDQGRVIGDSGLIIDYLKATYGDPLDQWLTPSECAVALAFQHLMEEHLYWIGVYSRWVEPEGWKIIREAFFRGLRPPLKWIVPELARRTLKRELHDHGLERHRRDEIYQLGQADTTAIADFLGRNHFSWGTGRPRSMPQLMGF